jgi:hypothetical protein
VHHDATSRSFHNGNYAVDVGVQPDHRSHQSCAKHTNTNADTYGARRATIDYTDAGWHSDANDSPAEHADPSGELHTALGLAVLFSGGRRYIRVNRAAYWKYRSEFNGGELSGKRRQYLRGAIASRATHANRANVDTGTESDSCPDVNG